MCVCVCVCVFDNETLLKKFKTTRTSFTWISNYLPAFLPTSLFGLAAGDITTLKPPNLSRSNFRVYQVFILVKMILQVKIKTNMYPQPEKDQETSPREQWFWWSAYSYISISEVPNKYPIRLFSLPRPPWDMELWIEIINIWLKFKHWNELRNGSPITWKLKLRRKLLKLFGWHRKGI